MEVCPEGESRPPSCQQVYVLELSAATPYSLGPDSGSKWHHQDKMARLVITWHIYPIPPNKRSALSINSSLANTTLLERWEIMKEARASWHPSPPALHLALMSDKWRKEPSDTDWGCIRHNNTFISSEKTDVRVWAAFRANTRERKKKSLIPPLSLDSSGIEHLHHQNFCKESEGHRRTLPLIRHRLCSTTLHCQPLEKLPFVWSTLQVRTLGVR